jgi:hypothetical protein
MIINPVAMTWDERGRLWVVELHQNALTSNKTGKDRIKVLDDIDGDGKADKVIVFADGFTRGHRHPSRPRARPSCANAGLAEFGFDARHAVRIGYRRAREFAVHDVDAAPEGRLSLARLGQTIIGQEFDVTVGYIC